VTVPENAPYAVKNQHVLLNAKYAKSLEYFVESVLVKRNRKSTLDVPKIAKKIKEDGIRKRFLILRKLKRL
jgi:hypothetical protein